MTDRWQNRDWNMCWRTDVNISKCSEWPDKSITRCLTVHSSVCARDKLSKNLYILRKLDTLGWNLTISTTRKHRYSNRHKVLYLSNTKKNKLKIFSECCIPPSYTIMWKCRMTTTPTCYITNVQKYYNTLTITL